MRLPTLDAGYEIYMASPEWAALRKIKLQETGHRCQGCGDDERLEVHHLSYARFGHERLEELMVLCHLCHAHEHGREPNVGAIAGPGPKQFAAAARVHEAARHQRDALGVAWEHVAACRETVRTSRQRKRIKSIEHHLKCYEREVAEAYQAHI